MKAREYYKIIAAFLTSLLIVFMLAQTGYVQEAGTFNQTDWSGGSSANDASHPGDQSSWAEYTSRDSNILTSGGALSLSANTFMITDTTDTDFSDGTLKDIVINGTGNAAQVELTSSVTDSFASGLGEWLNLPSIPDPGTFSTYTRMGNYIYCLFASGDGKQFGRFHITNQVWEFLAPMSVAVAAGATITNDGQYIYALRGSGSKETYFYLPSDVADPDPGNTAFPMESPPPGEWRQFLSLTKGINLGSDLAHTGNELTHATTPGRLFALGGGDDRNFFEYNPDIGGGVWRDRASTPDNVEQGGALAYKTGADYIYCTPGRHYETFWRYQISTNSWDTGIADLPDLYGYDTEFWRGSDIWYPGSGDYIYAAGMYDVRTRLGTYRTDRGFYRYGPLTGSPVWEKLPNLPAPTAECKFIMYDPDLGGPSEGEELQFFSGRNYTRPWRYDIVNGKWSTLVQAPTDRGYGINICYPGIGDYIYYVPAEDSSTFFRYSISNNEWEQLAHAPSGIRHGGNRLGYLNGYVYCLRGAESDDFWRYDVSQTPGSDAWETLTDFPQNVDYGSGVIGINVGGTDYMYALRGTDTYDFYRYDVAGETWESMDSTTDSMDGSFMVYSNYTESDGYTYIYACRGQWSRNFYKYGPIEDDISDQDDLDSDGNNLGVWTKVTDAPNNFRFHMDAGPSIAHTSAANNYVYGLSADWDSIGYSYGFVRYNMDTDAWDILEPTPFHQARSCITGTDTAIFAIANYGYNNFWKYDPATGQWNEPVIDRHDNQMGMTVADANNNIYVIHGDESSCPSHFWVYNADQNRWTDLIRVPFVLAPGAKASYLTATNSIYITKGRGSTEMYRYDITTKTWIECAESSLRFWRGAEVAADNDNDRIFMMGGWGSTNFVVYNSSDYWSSFADAPRAHDDWLNGLVYAQGKVYLMPGDDESTFHEYDPSVDTWLSRTQVGDETGMGETVETTGSGGVLFYPGSGDYIYSIPRATSEYLYRYSITQDLWEQLAKLPITTSSYEASIVTVGKPWFYIFNYQWGSYFMRYHVTENTYDLPSFLPEDMNEDCSFAGYKGYIYYLNRDAFHRYSTIANTWSTLADPPLTFDQTDTTIRVVEYQGQPSIYVTGGNSLASFYRYDVAADLWIELSPPPDPFEVGNSICHYGDYLYILRGESNTFWQYDLADDSWSVLNDTPQYVGYGGQVVYPGSDDYLYVMTGNRSSNLYRYHIGSGSWSVRTPAPVPLHTGHSEAIYPGFGNYLYLIHGSSWWDWSGSYVFLRYDVENNLWEELTPASFNIRHPGTLIWADGEYFYATQGRGRKFAKYYAFCFGNYTSKIKEIGNHSGWGNISWDFNDIQCATVSFRAGNETDLSDTSEWFNIADVANGADLSTSAACPDTAKYLQYKITFSTDNLLESPAIEEMRIEWEKYPISQMLISSVYDTTFATSRLLDLTWQETLPLGTDARLQLRTSADNISWTEWLGIADAQVLGNDYSMQADYAYSSKIEVSAGTAKIQLELADFKHAQAVIIDNTGGVEKTDELVSLKIFPSNTHFWDNVRSEGSDIRFYDGSIKLSYYLSTFDYASKSISIDVKIPLLSADSIQTIYVLYGSVSAISESDSTIANRWSYPNYTGWTDNVGSSDPETYTSGGHGMMGKYGGEGQYTMYTKSNAPAGSYEVTFDYYWMDSWDGERGYLYANGGLVWNTYQFTAAQNIGNITTRSGSDYLGRAYKVTFDHPGGDLTLRFTSNLSSGGDYDESFGVDNIVLGGGAFACFSVAQELASSPALSGWQYRLPITITNSGLTDLTDEIINIKIDNWHEFWKNVKIDGEDVRVVDSDDSTVLESFLKTFDYANTEAEVCAKIPFIAAESSETIYLYYGNSAAEYPSKGGVEFEDGDLFAGLPDFSYANKIVLDNTGGEAGTDVLVKVEIPFSNLQFWANVQTDGDDIRFHDGTQTLEYCLELFNYAEKTAVIFVEIPTIAIDEIKTIHLLYGSASAASDSNDTIINVGDLNISSAGSDDGPRDHYVYVDGTLRHTTTISWAVTRLDADLNWVESMQYDCHNDSAQADAMEAYLAGLPDDTLIIVTTYDEPRNNIYNNTSLKNELKNFGASDALLSGLAYRSKYLMIGRKGLNAGEAYVEKYGPRYGSCIQYVSATERMPLTLNKYIKTYFSMEEEAGTCPGLAAWAYKIPITVTNFTTADITNQLVELKLDNWHEFWSNVKNDGGDIRIVDSDDTTVLNYYLDSFDFVSKKAMVYTKIPSFSALADKTIYLYYGNPGASGASDLSASAKGIIAVFVHNFHGTTIAGSTFMYGGGTVTQNEYVTLQNNSDDWDCYLNTNNFYARSNIEFCAKIKADSGSRTMIGWKSNAGGASYQDMPHAIYFDNGNFHIYEDGSYRQGVGSYSPGTWYEIRIVLKSMGADYYYRIVDSSTWTLLYESSYSSESNLKPHIVHHDSGEQAHTDEWAILENNTVGMAQDAEDTYVHPANTHSLTNYYDDNPVIQPIIGVFYEGNLVNFQDVVTEPAGTEVGYQVSADGYNWYWHNGSSWAKVDFGYANTNTAAEINANLTNFQSQFPDGDFYYRAYLHTDDGINTPELDEVTITLASPPSYYFDSAGAEAINTLNEDCLDDRYLQYKTTLYSYGESTPVIDSIDIDYIRAEINVSSPDGAEQWAVASSHTITWTSEGVDGAASNVQIEYSADTGSSWNEVIASTANDGSHGWTVPDSASPNALVRVSSVEFPNVSDESDAIFQIMGLIITSPNGGDIWEAGRQHTITWASTGTVNDNLTIEYSPDNGSTWIAASTQRPNTGNFNWTIANDPSDEVLLKIYDADNTDVVDESDAVWAIVPQPILIVGAPNGAEQWIVGNQYEVNWATNSTQFVNNVIIDYSTDNFSTETAIITTSIGTPSGSDANDTISGTYDWTVPEDISTTVKVRIREDSILGGRDTQSIIWDMSDADFSIVFPYITITSPVSGLTWVSADIHDITWTIFGTVTDDLLFEYTTDGLIFNTIADNEACDGIYAWTIPDAIDSNIVQVQITDNAWTQVTGISEAFTVIPYPIVTMLDPNGGEVLAIGEEYDITWESYGQKLESGGADYYEMAIYYSDDNGGSWNLISNQQTNDGLYTWTVADVETIEALIRVMDENDALVVDVSNDVFQITIPAVTITSPNGAETWYATGDYEITWTFLGAVTNDLLLEYSSNGGVAWNTIATGEPNDQTYTWDVADDLSDQVLVRLTDNARATVWDMSDAVFSIVAPTITVTSPNGAEEWIVGTTHGINWTSEGNTDEAIRDDLTIEYSSDGGGAWNTVSSAEANDGDYVWTIPNDLSTNCLVRIFDATRIATTDQSDSVFAIRLPYVNIIAPNGGESWAIGTAQEITWGSLGSVSDNLRIEYSKDNFGSDINLIANFETNDGTYDWIVVDDYSITAKIRVTDNDTPAISDMSDVPFAIAYPVIRVTVPNGGELWTVSDAEIITWDNTGSVGNDLLIEYSKDNFISDVNTIIGSTTNSGSHNWTIPNDVSASMRVRITDNTRPVVWDRSDGMFTVLPIPQLTILTPNGSEIWRVGTIQDVTWEDNGGLISNNLTVQYSSDGGTVYQDITTGAANMGAYSWTIPDDVSAICLVKVFDADRPSNEDVSDDVFAIADPLITITAPNGGEVWAVADQAPATWTTEGSISDNLVAEYSPDGGSTYFVIGSGELNDGEYTWDVPDDVTNNALFKLTDGNRPVSTDVSDEFFRIIPIPTFDVTAPDGGEEFVLGDMTTITWTWEGLSISDNLVIDMSGDGFATRRIIAVGEANDGLYTWDIPDDALTGPTLKLRITDGNRSEITNQSAGFFRIRGGFTINVPNGDEDWVAKSDHTVMWQTRGTIAKIKLDYSTDNGLNWNLIAANVDNIGSYVWILPDAQTTEAMVRVSDPDDSTVFDVNDAVFNIVYASVVFNILDYDTLQHLQDVNVNEPGTGWNDSGLNSAITRSASYPYATYTTFLSKTNFIDNSVTWVVPKSGTDTYIVNIYLENSASAQVTWEAILTYSFSPGSDTLSAVGSLQRKGKLVGTNALERADMGPAVLSIYTPDGTTVRNNVSANAPNENGMYTLTLPGTGFEAGYVYPATLTVLYRGRDYTSSANIDVGSEILQYEFFTQTATQLAASVAQIEESVGEGTESMITELEDTRDSLEGTLEEATDNLTETMEETTTALTEELSATRESLEGSLAAAEDELQTTMKSKILNREKQAKSGDEINVRYQTYSGMSPKIDVYDVKNVQRIIKGSMVEMGTTGIYEYPVKFYSAWGIGDYTIICSEETRGTLDSLTITVVRNTVDDIAGQTSAILGATSGLSDIGGIVDILNNQVGLIETSFTRIAKDFLNEAKQGSGMSKELNIIYKQLSDMGSQIKEFGKLESVGIENRLEVAAEKKKDIKYLKNKTQEMKAMLELNNQMIENISDKPMSQVWYEF
ncbi:MAG: DUF2341 domain-containing protein [PVC group bacterium]|nr:DUF2341 domain-containing protein [PVC group bacterium]